MAADHELIYCKASCAKKWEALPNCNNLIRLLTSCFAHCLPQSFSSPSLFVLLSLSFIFILSPGAVEHLVYLPYSPHSLTTAQRVAKPGKYWQGAPVTRRKPVNAQTPRAGVNDKMVGSLETNRREKKEREKEKEKGKEVDRCGHTRDMQWDSITLRQEKPKVKEKETEREIPDRGQQWYQGPNKDGF